jgi:adenylate cyclase class IV
MQERYKVMHEVEVRGLLKDFNKTLSFFKSNAKFIEEKDRFSLIYFPKDTLDLKEMQDDPRDLRLRITNKKAEIVIKYGKWGVKDSRREISIPIPKEKFDETAELLHYLGWSFGSVFATKTFVFEYKGVEFALVKNKFLDYFEAEKLIETNETCDETMKEIEEVCKELGLSLFSEEEYFKLMDKINRSPGSIFDLRKQKFSDITKDYKEFF